MPRAAHAPSLRAPSPDQGFLRGTTSTAVTSTTFSPLLAALADDSNGVRMRASVVDADAGVIDVSVVSTATNARAGRHGSRGVSGGGPRVYDGGGRFHGGRRPLAEVSEGGMFAGLRRSMGVHA